MEVINEEFKRQVEELREDANSMKIQIAELNVIVKNDKQELKKLEEENERMKAEHKSSQ